MNRFNKTSLSNLELCHNSVEICMGEKSSITLHLLVTASLLLNIFHLILLGSTKYLRGKSFKKILVLFCVVDIYGTMTSYIQYNCPLRIAVIGRPVDVLIYLLVIPAVTAPIDKVYLISLAMYDKYVNVCHHLSHGNNLIVKHIYVTYLCITILLTAIVAVAAKLSSSPGSMCVHTIYGVWSGNFSNTGIGIMGGLMNFLPFIITLYFVVRILIQLKLSLRYLSQTNSRLQLDVLVAVRYIFLITMLYFISLMVPFMCLISFEILHIDSGQLDFFVTVLYELYGIINVVMYGWVSEQYKIEAKSLISRCCILRRGQDKQASTVGPHPSQVPFHLTTVL